MSLSPVHTKIPSSGREPGYFEQEDYDELTNISTSDIILAFGDECVDLEFSREIMEEREEREIVKKIFLEQRAFKGKINKQETQRAIKTILMEQRALKKEQRMKRQVSTISLEEMLLD